MKIAHIINPVKVGPQSDLFVAQPVTFSSMQKAKEYTGGNNDIELCSIGYPEDREIVPGYFRILGNLERSILEAGNFAKPRKLPLIKEILDTAVQSCNSDYLIYSNVDIGVMPFFYEAAANLLETHDALIINRRTIAKSETADLPLSFFYQQAGEKHPGFDCFVFKRDLYEKFFLGEACIGVNWIGRVLICNLLAYAKSCKIIEDAHLTFHLGDDRSWRTTDFVDYESHNEAVVSELITRIADADLLHKHPLLPRTYEEFYKKSIDPDPSRPKAKPQVVGGNAGRIVDTASLPVAYLSSSSWGHIKHTALRQDPVFIVGHPRSGTTLLQSLVATQFAQSIFPETHFFSIARKKLHVENDRVQSACLTELFLFLDKMLEPSSSIKVHITALVARSEMSPKMLFEALVFDQLAKHLPAQDISPTRWMEKTPDHAEHMEDMLRYYPNAKFVFVARDPRKAIPSRRKYFTWNNETSWPIEKHVNAWLKTMRAYETFEHAHPESVFLVRHEDVVADTEGSVAKICRFIGVPFNKALLGNHAQFSRQQNLEWETWKKDTETAVSTDVSNKASHSLSSIEKDTLKQGAGDYLKKYGYLDDDERPAKFWGLFSRLFRRL